MTGTVLNWRQCQERLVAALPSAVVGKVPWDRSESGAALRRRRWVVAGVSVVGAGLLGRSLSTKPGSPQFYGLTLGVATTWIVGGLGSGPLHLGWGPHHDHTRRRPVITPVLTGVGAFAVCYVCALVARHVPVLDRAVSGVLQYARQGSGPFVLLTTLANGAAEEVFFRGALYAAAGNYPVTLSTAGYSLATTATRNPALVLASTAMGTLLGLQRRATGGIQAPILTHLTWSALMLHFLPPLFCDNLHHEQLDPASTVAEGPFGSSGNDGGTQPPVAPGIPGFTCQSPFDSCARTATASPARSSVVGWLLGR